MINFILAAGPEAKFQTIVTLLAGIVVVLGGIGTLIWRMGVWINRQADATRDNTIAINNLSVRVNALEKKI